MIPFHFSVRRGCVSKSVREASIEEPEWRLSEMPCPAYLCTTSDVTRWGSRGMKTESMPNEIRSIATSNERQILKRLHVFYVNSMSLFLIKNNHNGIKDSPEREVSGFCSCCRNRMMTMARREPSRDANRTYKGKRQWWRISFSRLFSIHHLTREKMRCYSFLLVCLLVAATVVNANDDEGQSEDVVSTTTRRPRKNTT